LFGFHAFQKLNLICLQWWASREEA